MASARVSLVFGSVFGASLLFFASAGTVVGVTACSSKDAAPETDADKAALAIIETCENISTGCADNITSTPAEMETCSGLLAGSCAAATISFQNCVANKCTDAGLVDYGAIAIDCEGYQTVLEDCIEGAAEAGTVASGGSGASGGGVVVVTAPTSTPVKDAAVRD